MHNTWFISTKWFLEVDSSLLHAILSHPSTIWTSNLQAEKCPFLPGSAYKVKQRIDPASMSYNCTISNVCKLNTRILELFVYIHRKVFHELVNKCKSNNWANQGKPSICHKMICINCFGHCKGPWPYIGPFSFTPNFPQQKHTIRYKSSKKNTYYSITIELCNIEPIATYHLIDDCLKSFAIEGTAISRCAVNDFTRY